MDSEGWGRKTAKERYSATENRKTEEGTKASAKPVNIGLIDQPELNEAGRVMQAPQAVNDKHLPTYDNDVGANWLRGMGKGEAEGKPSFDKHKSGGK